MFYLVEKTGKNVLAWAQAAPTIEDSNTQEIVEIPGSVPANFKGVDSKIINGAIQDLTTGEKTSAVAARKSKRDSSKYIELKAIIQANLADFKTLLGIN